MASIQGVYLALFGRPADPLGLAFFNQATNNGANLTAIGDLSASAEYQTRFTGQSNTQIITSIYRSLFNRDPDLAGLTFFANALANKTLTINNIAIAIFDGAQGSDVTIRDLKVAAANSFTAAIDTVAEINGYSGTAAANSGAAFIATVTTTAPTAAQIDAAVAAATTAPQPGTVVTLTTGADNVVGTNGNETVNAFVNTTANTTTSTFSAADTIATAGGTDTLNVTFDGTGAAVLPGAAISGVEVVNLRNLSTDATALAVNADNLVGATQIWNDRGVGASDLTVTNLATGAAGGVRGNGSAQISDSSFGYKTATAAATLVIDGGVKGGTGSGANAAAEDANATTVTVSSTPSAVTINSTGAANTVNNIALGGAATALTVNATTDLTVAGAEFSGDATTALTDWVTGFAANAKITTTGAGKVSLGTLQATNVVEVDASANAGGTTVGLNNVTGIKFTGGAGQDIVSTGALLAGTALVDAAGGTTDRLIVTASGHIDGTVQGFYKGFEQLQVQNGVTVNVAQLATNNTIDTIRINDGNGATGVTNLSAAQAGAVQIIAADSTNGAITIGVKDATVGGQIDTVKATLTTTTSAGAAQASDLTGITLAGVEKLELTGTGTVASTTGAVTFTAANATALDSIKFSNVANGNTLNVDAVAAANLNVDASASAGGVTIDADAYNSTTGATLKGGSSFDVLLGSARGDNLSGGAGNDVIAGTALGGFTAGTASAIGTVTTSIAASSAADVFTGGEGRDMFAIGRVDAIGNISSITDLNLGGTTAAAGVDGITVDLAVAGAATIVTLSDAQKSTVSSALTLTAAVEAALQVASGQNNAVQFTYGTDTYLAVNGANAGFAVADDVLVKITGVTGTLDASDLTVI